MTGLAIPTFPNVEKLLVAWLTSQITARVCTELDASFAVPVVQIERISGSDYDYVIDHPVVDVDVYAATRGQASDLAQQIHDLLRFVLPGAALPSGGVTSTRTVVGPRVLPYDDTSKRRCSATYQFCVVA